VELSYRCISCLYKISQKQEEEKQLKTGTKKKSLSVQLRINFFSMASLAQQLKDSFFYLIDLVRGGSNTNPQDEGS